MAEREIADVGSANVLPILPNALDMLLFCRCYKPYAAWTAHQYIRFGWDIHYLYGDNMVFLGTTGIQKGEKWDLILKRLTLKIGDVSR